MNNVKISEVKIPPDRQRKDFGDIALFAKSIQDNGLIQPIVLTSTNEGIVLVAGERRIRALTHLGVTELIYGDSFIWKSDLSGDEPEKIYRRKAVEFEENLRRKQLTWYEEVLAKQTLLELYQKIYGQPLPGQPSKVTQVGLKPAGFSARTLSKMLNESVGQTSEDLQMAALVTQIPSLKNEPSREAATRKLKLALMIQAGKAGVHMAKPLLYKIIVECDNEAHQIALLTQFRTAGLKCQAIVS